MNAVRSDADCTANQIDPKYNDWTPCLEEGLKSCKVDPASSHRPAKRSLAGELGIECDGNGGGLPAGVKFVKSIPVRDDLGYHVHKRPNAVVVVQFEGEARAANTQPARSGSPSIVDM